MSARYATVQLKDATVGVLLLTLARDAQLTIKYRELPASFQLCIMNRYNIRKKTISTQSINHRAETLKNSKQAAAAAKAAAPGKPLERIILEGFLIGLIATCAFITLSLFTFHPNDPGWSNTGRGEIRNAAGPAGAWLANIFFSLFGQMAYAFPTMLIYKAFNILREKRAGRFDPLVYLVRIVGFALSMIAATGLMVQYTGYEAGHLPFSSGGLIGIATAETADTVFGVVGGSLLLVSILLFGLTIFLDISWIALMDSLGKSVLAIGTFIQHKTFVWRRLQRERKEVSVVVASRKAQQAKQAKESAKRIPPSISVLPKPTKTLKSGVRTQKEKQQSLFDSLVTGDLPAINLLDSADRDVKKGYSQESLEEMSRSLEVKLKDFGIDAAVVEVLPGPVVTRFEIQPAAGVKVSRITNLAKDLARSLAVISVRVVEVIEGKSVVGIEIPNQEREMVRLSAVLSSAVYEKSRSPLTLALGHDISGQPMVADLAKMPHLLVAGTTGSGKSVGVNAMLLSLLYKASPKEVRLLLVDPKMLELSVYEGIPHLLAPVITDMKDAATGLRWCVGEMERRYKLMAALGVRNLAGFNKKVEDAARAGSPLRDPIWRPESGMVGEDAVPPDLDTLPAIVVVIDEFADMMMIVGKKVEQLIARIAQKARAAGIHLILATQRPSVDVITGLIKANVPTRMAFQVSSKIDSRTILDQGGAEQLLGHGDMLYLPPGTSLPVRVHGAFVDDHEVHNVVADWKRRGEPDYLEEIFSESTENIAVPGYSDSGGNDSDSESDPLYDEAVAFVTETRKASISSVQRKLRIGYNRAARLIEQMEVSGVVTEMSGNGNREVLAPPPPR